MEDAYKVNTNCADIAIQVGIILHIHIRKKTETPQFKRATQAQTELELNDNCSDLCATCIGVQYQIRYSSRAKKNLWQISRKRERYMITYSKP